MQSLWCKLPLDIKENIQQYLKFNMIKELNKVNARTNERKYGKCKGENCDVILDYFDIYRKLKIAPSDYFDELIDDEHCLYTKRDYKFCLYCRETSLICNYCGFILKLGHIKTKSDNTCIDCWCTQNWGYFGANAKYDQEFINYYYDFN